MSRQRIKESPDMDAIRDLIVELIRYNDRCLHEEGENYLLGWVHLYRKTGFGKAIRKEIAFREGLFGGKCSRKVGLLTGMVKPEPVKKVPKSEMLGTSAAFKNNVGFIGLIAEELRLHEKESR